MSTFCPVGGAGAVGADRRPPPAPQHRRRRHRGGPGHRRAGVRHDKAGGHAGAGRRPPIGVPLAVCGKTSFIAPSASMTLHPSVCPARSSPPRRRTAILSAFRRELWILWQKTAISPLKSSALMLDSGDMGQRCGHGSVRKTGGGGGPHRPGGHTVRCPGSPVRHGGAGEKAKRNDPREAHSGAPPAFSSLSIRFLENAAVS